MNKTFSCFAFPLNRCASIPSGENESSIRDEVTRTDKFLTKYKRMRVQCTVLREHRNPVTFQFIYIYIRKSRYSFRSVYFPTFLRILKATSCKTKKSYDLDGDSFRSSNVTRNIHFAYLISWIFSCIISFDLVSRDILFYRILLFCRTIGPRNSSCVSMIVSRILLKSKKLANDRNTRFDRERSKGRGQG